MDNEKQQTVISAVGDGGIGHGLGTYISQKYLVECFRKDAQGVDQLLWTESFGNIVVTAGLNKYLQFTIVSGLAAPAWYVGLKGAGVPAAGDTMASHATWTESTVYSNATRPAFTPGAVAAGSVDNSAAKAAFTINGSATISGAFMADNGGKGTATGTLLGAGDFSTGRAVESGDTLNVQVTCTMAAA
uniref:Uncharacterized protein n=1 Tax=viral metagenome TaxID=1070528 RepID=A0A6M3JW17_9ZZZZ